MGTASTVVPSTNVDVESWTARHTRAGGEGSRGGIESFRRAFGVDLCEVLNLGNWTTGVELLGRERELADEVTAATAAEAQIRDLIRVAVLPQLRARAGAPPEAGVYRATPDDLRQVQHAVLFPGLAEACDGTSAMTDMLPLTILQFGIGLASYYGEGGTWTHRLFHRDIRDCAPSDAVELRHLLERRDFMAGFDLDSPQDAPSRLARRALMTYAERLAVVGEATAPWRVGHGNILAYELLTGSGFVELITPALEVLRALVAYERWVYVPSAPSSRALLTIGNALEPREYAVIDTLRPQVEHLLLTGHYRGAWAEAQRALREFAREVASQVVVGVYRAADLAPPMVFYAHAARVHEAALVAMADAALQPHRGFPMLIDVAHAICNASVSTSALTRATDLALARAGDPFRYTPERRSRQ